MTDDPIRERLAQATGGRYVIDEELGRGGMAVVFGATDVRLKRAVAIKALPPDLAFRADVRSRFIREAQMAAGLSHPHIVSVYSVDEHEGLVYMVMARVRGESLAQRLHREGRLPYADARRIMRETADALAHAHAHGVIHRDIKPDNILLESGTGRVMVTDFGIARAMEGDARLTVTGVAVGTPTYMSPEQARGDDDVDGRADVYSLGVVGYQMLVGEPPFTAPNTPALLLKHVSEPPPPLTARRGDIPLPLSYAVERALAKDRTVRWGTAAALRDALADDAFAPPRAGAQEIRLPSARPNGQGGWAAPAELPPYPVWHGGGQTEREAWREAQRAWRAQVRAQRDAPVARGARDGIAPGPVFTTASIVARVRRFQWKLVSHALIAALTFFMNVGTGEPIWFVFVWFGLAVSVVSSFARLWQDGVPVKTMLSRPSRLERLPEVSVHVDATAAADARVRALVTSDVLHGHYGDFVRRAVDDERAAREVLATLAPADRAQLPDVEATVTSLVDRVAALATTMHRLEADVRPEQLSELDVRIANARQGPDPSGDAERRVQLLERQRASVAALLERRDTLRAQLENAALVLQTMRLDLLRLRSAGIANAVGEVSTVTQQARALSVDIGRVIDAAAEVRKL